MQRGRGKDESSGVNEEKQEVAESAKASRRAKEDSKAGSQVNGNSCASCFLPLAVPTLTSQLRAPSEMCPWAPFPGNPARPSLSSADHQLVANPLAERAPLRKGTAPYLRPPRHGLARGREHVMYTSPVMRPSSGTRGPLTCLPGGKTVNSECWGKEGHVLGGWVGPHASPYACEGRETLEQRNPSKFDECHQGVLVGEENPVVPGQENPEQRYLGNTVRY